MKSFSDADIQTFVEKETANWMTLPDSVFDGVPDDIAAAAKEADRQQLQISYEDLVRVMRQRRDKASFAYQYDLWLTDYTAMMIDFMKNPRDDSPQVQRATLNVAKNGLHYKLSAMQRWYHTVFTDTPVAEMPDQEMIEAAKGFRPTQPAGKNGCLVLFVAILTGAGTLGLAFISFVLKW